MPRPLIPLNLSPGQRQVLESFIHSGKTVHWLHQRSTIILMAAAGADSISISQTLQLNKNTVGRWRQRWLNEQAQLTPHEQKPALLAQGIRHLLSDKPRAGSPPDFSAEQVCQIIALACKKPPSHLSHWSLSELARAAVEQGIAESISRSSIERFLKSGRPETASCSILAEPDHH